MMKIQLSLACAVFVLGMTAPTFAAYPKENLGTYKFVGGKAERAALNKAIEKICAKANFFIRGAVRSELKKAFKIVKIFSIMQKNKTLGIKVKGQKSFFSQLNGKRSLFKAKTGLVYVTRSFSGTTLKERVQEKGKKGYQKSSYIFKDGGKTILFKTFSHIPSLKSNIAYTLTYRR